MTINTLVLSNARNSLSIGTYAVELEYRLAALMALYQKQCAVSLDTYSFGADLRAFISRGGRIHYALGPDGEGALLGFAAVLGSCSLLENIFPVERFIVDTTLPQDLRQEAAIQLIKSIVEQAQAELPHRHDDIWVQVSFPTGADSLEVNQPIYTALELNGFQASRTSGMVSWTAWIRRTRVAVNEAA